MYVFGDNHIGVSRRNNWYYNKVKEVFSEILSKNRKEVTVFAGDLWDCDTPRPIDLLFVKDILSEEFETSKVYIIPGNHDRICVDKTCAGEVLSSSHIQVFKSLTIIDSEINNTLRFFFLPYSATMIEELREYIDTKGEWKEHNILISHFSLQEANPYAGIISEKDPVFKPFEAVILGDTHSCYDNGKFHTTGSTYFCNVDEMYSKKCIPSLIHINESTCTIDRISYPEYKPEIIESEEEAVDDSKLYLIVSNETITTTKPNVFVKYKVSKKDEENVLRIEESISLQGGINKDKFFELIFPDMNQFKRNKLKAFESGNIDLEELLDESDTISTVLSKTETEAIFNGMLEEQYNIF